MTDQLTNQKSLYQEGLEDPRLRVQILKRDNQSCRICGKQEGLQVHHRQYHRYKSTGEWSHPWEYHPVLLLTVCDRCHASGHKSFPIPIKEI